MNEIQLYSNTATALTVKNVYGHYIISAPCGEKKLVRGTDFGVIRKGDGTAMTKTPTLFKPGAEKIAVAYGLCQRYETQSAIEDPEKGFFFYRVKCNLVKVFNGCEYIITSAEGSANTREKRCGSQSPYDGANSALKMAQKRALVSAALSLGCVSDMFTQDIESDMEDANVYFAKDPNAKITAKQVQFFYATASRNGVGKTEAKAFLASHGYKSASEIKQGELDALIDELAQSKTAEAEVIDV